MLTKYVKLIDVQSFVLIFLLQVKLYVNGMLYSILTVPSIRRDAREMVNLIIVYLC